MTADEFIRDRSPWPIAPDVRAATAGLMEAYHAARCREATGDGPVREARLEQIRRSVTFDVGRRSIEPELSERKDLLAALDHARSQCAALEGVLDDYLADNARLVEEGRRLEREEVAAKLLEVAAHLQTLGDDGFRRGDAIKVVTRLHILPRGPAPERLPGDAARARVRELEAALRVAIPDEMRAIAREALGEAT